MDFNPFIHLPEIREETLLYLPYDDIISLCVSHPDLSYICSDNRFWKRKVRRDFHVERLKPEEISHRQQYKDLITYNDPNKAAEEGRLDILIVLEKEERLLPNRRGASLAARNGHIDVLEWLEERKIFPSFIGANETAANGHIDVLEWLEEREILPTEYGANWAAANGQLHVLMWLAKRDRLPTKDGADWATKNGHFHVLEWWEERDIFRYHQ